jgi:hypothetical protein
VLTFFCILYFLIQKNKSARKKRLSFRVVELFLSLELGTASRKLGIVCSLFRGQGQTCVLKADCQVSQPNHTMRQDRRLYTHRRQRMNPNPQHCWFREFPISEVLQLVPKLYVRYVRRQLGVLSENQGLLAKIFTSKKSDKRAILGFLPLRFLHNIFLI